MQAFSLCHVLLAVNFLPALYKHFENYVKMFTFLKQNVR